MDDDEEGAGPKKTVEQLASALGIHDVLYGAAWTYGLWALMPRAADEALPATPHDSVNLFLVTLCAAFVGKVHMLVVTILSALAQLVLTHAKMGDVRTLLESCERIRGAGSKGARAGSLIDGGFEYMMATQPKRYEQIGATEHSARFGWSGLLFVYLAHVLIERLRDTAALVPSSLLDAAASKWSAWSVALCFVVVAVIHEQDRLARLSRALAAPRDEPPPTQGAGHA